MKKVFVFMCLPLVIGLLNSGCGGGEEASIENEEDLAASVEDWTLTKDFLYRYIDQLPGDQKEKYNNPRGRAELAENILADELFYREALRQDLSEKGEVRKQLEDARRSILIQAYFKEFIEERARPTEEEMREWYDSHEHVYTTQEGRKAQHVFSESKEKLEDIKARYEAGEKFTTLAHKYSEDKLTSYDGGNLGYFNPGGYIRGVGFSETLNDTMFKIEPHKVYGPIKWEKGYSLVRVNKVVPAQLRPFEEVRDEISRHLTRERIERVRQEVISEIRDNYDVKNYMEEFYRSIQRTPKELFEYAQNTADPRERIRAFEEIVEKFPDDEHAPQALFMVGFVHAEELKDVSSASFNFKKVLREYPDSDVADSAKWMLENMGENLPEFENIEDLNKKLSND